MKLNDHMGGMMLMATAALLLPVADSLSKSLAQNYEPLQIVWARNLFHLILFAPLAFLMLRKRGMRISSLRLLMD